METTTTFRNWIANRRSDPTVVQEFDVKVFQENALVNIVHLEIQEAFNIFQLHVSVNGHLVVGEVINEHDRRFGDLCDAFSHLNEDEDYRNDIDTDKLGQEA